MTFDWLAFCRRHNLDFKESGKSTAKGNVYIACPFCRDDKKNMGLSLTSPFWACWKDPKGHGGKDPTYLVMVLLRCSKEQAKAEVNSNDPGVTDLESLKERLLGAEPGQASLKGMDYLPEFMPIFKGAGPPISWYSHYIENRGFTRPEAVAEYYDLRAATSGYFSGRIIMPFDIKGRRLGWTGRAISKKQELRYLTEPRGDGVSRMVFNYDRAAEGGRILAAVEGPWDAVKVDWYGRREGIRAVAMLGLNLNSARVELLTDLMQHFDSLVLMMDEEALGRSVEFTSRVPHLEPRVVRLPTGVKDPGDLVGSTVAGLFL